MKPGQKSFLLFPSMVQSKAKQALMKAMATALDRMGFEGIHVMIKREGQPMRMWMYGRLV